MQDPKSHILVHGRLYDCLSGEERDDTDDERIRQQLAQQLLAAGFAKKELLTAERITTNFNHSVISTIDFVACCGLQPVMILRCAPGSLVSRERAAIAAARVWHPQFQLPLAMVFNGRDGELIETERGRILQHGLDSLPSKKELETTWLSAPFRPALTGSRRERELRILNAFDLQQCCLQEKCLVDEKKVL